MEAGDSLPGFCQADTVVMGCGNRLLGDDGFGPAVISYCVNIAKFPTTRFCWTPAPALAGYYSISHSHHLSHGGSSLSMP